MVLTLMDMDMKYRPFDHEVGQSSTPIVLACAKLHFVRVDTVRIGADGIFLNFMGGSFDFETSTMYAFH